MPKARRVVEIDDDSDEEETYWDADDWPSTDTKFIEGANKLADSVNDTPVSSMETPSKPLGRDLEKLLLKSGGTPLSYDNSSPTKSSAKSKSSTYPPPRANYPTTTDHTPTRPVASSSRVTLDSDDASPRQKRPLKVNSTPFPRSPAEFSSNITMRRSPASSRPSDASGNRTKLPLSRTVVTEDTDVEMDSDEQEVESLVATDTEASTVPSTRQNSFTFTSSRTTSMSSLWSEESDPGSSVRKKELQYPDTRLISSTSSRRVMTQDQQMTMGPPSSTPKAHRAQTYPTPNSQRIYPRLPYDIGPVDEPSVFRDSPVTDNTSKAKTSREGSSSSAGPSFAPAPPSPSNQPLHYNDAPRTPSRQPPTPSTSSAGSSRPTLLVPSKMPPANTARAPPQKAASTPVVFNNRPRAPTKSFSVPTVLEPGEETRVSNPAFPADLDFLKKMELSNAHHIIAHDKRVQAEMDLRRNSWGVQYEIARGVSKGDFTWSDVTSDKLDQLTGPNAEAAPKVYDVILGRQPSARVVNKEHWRELDRELKATLENKGRGLGLMGEWEGKPNWYGGQVQQIARIERASDGSSCPFHIHLETMEQRKSNRSARVLSSQCSLQLKVPKAMMHGAVSEELRKFLSQKFIICGRTFIPFHAKEEKAYMMQSNEDFERKPQKWCGDFHRMSLASFIAWHNPLDLNFKQPISKWATRWALLLSTSVPVLEFSYENIMYIEDIEAPHDPAEGKIPAEKIMTDGCGLVNGSALLKITQHMGLPHRPTAFQARIAGAKGMFLLNAEDDSPDSPPRIWIRGSQKKISHRSFADASVPLNRALLILDLLNPSRVTVGTRLSTYSILNLSHNGVPTDVIKALIEKDLEEEIAPLTRWSESMVPVAKAISSAGRITGTRLQRYAGVASRAHGFVRDFHKDEEWVEEATSDVPVSAGRDPYSGAPLSLHETAYDLLVAGFHPLHFPILSDKIHNVLKLLIDSYVKNFKIAVAESVEAFIMPDPFGVLEEGQIYFKSSEQNLVDASTGALFNVVKGPVVLGRNPVRMESDLQLVYGVDCPELSMFHDVVIFSTKGPRSLASYLGGGDYDGDTVFLIWLKAIVEHFQNRAFVACPQDLIERSFEEKKESITDFCVRMSSLSAEEARSEVQGALLLGLVDTRIGRYSIMHDTSVYLNGYSHPTTIELAYKCNTCLDSSKTGLKIRDEVFKADERPFQNRRVKSMVSDEASENSTSNTILLIHRPPHLGPFVLDILVEFGKRLAEEHLTKFEKLRKTVVPFYHRDDDLLGPKVEAEAAAKKAVADGYHRLAEDLKIIEKHVEAAYQLWCSAVSRSSESPSKSKSPSKKKPKAKTEGSSEDPWRKAARVYAEAPTSSHGGPLMTANLDVVKASFAYAHNPKFAMSVAHKDLCAIKARAGTELPMTREFGETMAIGASFVRALGFAETE